jgi:hypothetical protein
MDYVKMRRAVKTIQRRQKKAIRLKSASVDPEYGAACERAYQRELTGHPMSGDPDP